MSYEKQNWQKGDVITAAKLNNIEQGIADGGVLVVSANTETMALDKTWRQIADAALAVVQTVTGEGQTDIMLCTQIIQGDGIYGVYLGNNEFVCDDPDDYPQYDDGGGHSPIDAS